ncbi:iron-containing alcohol dehydrogenase [Clostridium sporogenes]|uniref:1-propanol dehydrogenase PduQ n=1 Tax=Clostridium sporogenes TaxID=1509 RepID=UPI0013D67F4E|nr:1-propanol dehydrogenase PduQ [Clostridium sporogenes]NFV11440.1 iron-containing alcohol dehydrogenase [Clostridium sporogenes]
MNSFSIKTKVHFGQGALNALNTIKDKKVFIVTDPFMVKSGMIDNIIKRLDSNKIEYSVFSEIVPDPPIEIVVKGIKEILKINPDILIALGGGSAIDAAKVIKDFSLKIVNIKEVEFIAIPTTSGTGSELTSFSVITDKEKGAKYPLVADELVPEVAILDPELVKSVPKFITADTGMDVLTHALEAYVSTKSSDFTDALAEKAIRLVFENLVEAYNNGNNLNAREKMHNASCMAGMAFNIASLGLNHGIAHAIGGKLHIPHGRINSILLPKIVEYNADIKGYTDVKYTEAANKYANVARLLNLPGGNIRAVVKNLIGAIEKLQKDMKMPRTLAECKVTDEGFNKFKDDISEMSLKDACTATNPKNPTKEDVLHILGKIRK